MSIIEVDVGPAWGELTDWQALGQLATTAAGMQSGHADLFGAELPVEISIRLTDDAEVQVLNRDYRGKDKPTNVLSFPQHAPYEIAGLATCDDPEILLGDIVVAHETCSTEAAAKGISLTDHVSHLIVHGTLHLLGYDHLDDLSADAMEALEVKALASLGIANPYVPDDPATARG